MIPAQRMQFLDKETNVGLVDPLKVKANDILNVATNQLNEITSGLADFIKNIQQQASAPAGMLQSLLDQGIRLTRDAFSAMSDISKLNPRAIESAIASMLPGNAAVQNAFKNITAQCRNKGLGTNSGFKPYNDSFGCGKGQGACNSSEVRGLLDKITGGAASQFTRSLNSMLKSVLALGRMGYDAGLCKVFGELIKGMPGNIVQRGAAGLLGLMGSNGNTSAVLDITANMGNAIPSLEIPGLVGIAMSNFTTPKNYNPNTFSDLADGYMTAMDGIQPGWNKTADGMTTMANVGDTRSGDFMNVLDNVCSRTPFDPDDLTGVVGGPLDAFTGAYKSVSSVKGLTSGLSSLFG